jgi:hypothetical protein
MSKNLKPPGWRKALAGVNSTMEIQLFCTANQCTSPDRFARGEHSIPCADYNSSREYVVEVYAMGNGWTYDRAGNWLCPVCSEGGEE